MNRIESPRTDDSAIEQEIQAKGLTAPRVTPDSIKAVIASEHYFTGDDGVEGAAAQRARENNQSTYGFNAPQALSLLTFCVLVLKNGFTVTGKSACASPENFDADIGRKVAFGDALNQIWPLEGYLLKQHLHDQACAYTLLHGEVQEAAPASTRPAHQQRVVTERDELLERTNKLAGFLVTPTFERLDEDEQTRLRDQMEYMVGYARVLSERIAAFPQ